MSGKPPPQAPPRPDRRPKRPDQSPRLGTPTGAATERSERPQPPPRWSRGSPRSQIPSAEAPVRLPSFTAGSNPRASSDLTEKAGPPGRDPAKCLGRSVSAMYLRGADKIDQPVKVAPLALPLRTSNKPAPRSRLMRDGPAAASTSSIEMKSGSQISTRSPRQGSFLKNPFAKRRSSSKTIDVDSFVPLSSDKKKERRRKSSAITTSAGFIRSESSLRHNSSPRPDSADPSPRQVGDKDAVENKEAEATATPKGPTRAYQGRRSVLAEDSKVNKRLSQNLNANAITLYSRLEDRPDYETLRSSMILRDAPPLPPPPCLWSSKPPLHEDWPGWMDDTESNPRPLTSRECLKLGFHIELGRSAEPTLEDMELSDIEKDVAFFQQLVDSGDVFHFVGNTSKGPVIVSMEDVTDKRTLQKAIIRTPQKDERILVNTMSAGKPLKALCNQCPSLVTAKLAKVKKEDTETWTKELLRIEKQGMEKNYKFGVLYAAAGQTTEDEYFNNVDGSEAFYEFLDSIANRITLKGWGHFRGGLDVKTETTGEYSYYEILNGCEMMFHVSTLIPYYPKDTQQVERKRHFGNDIVVIIFKEGDEPFDPSTIRSQFNHVFVVVRPLKQDGETHYQVEWSCKPGVPPFKPYETSPGIYEKGRPFKARFLTKLLNAQRAAMYAKDFEHKLARTRKMLFTELVNGPNN